MLRISDTLLQNFIGDVTSRLKAIEIEKNLIPKLTNSMKRIGIHFDIFKADKNSSGTWNWTSLMGPSKIKMLEYFPITEFMEGERGTTVQFLWREFSRLYNIMRKDSISDQEIDTFETDVRKWIKLFCRPSQNSLNSSDIGLESIYPSTSVSPYMHALANHVPQFMKQLNQKNLCLRYFSTSSIEKKNHQQVSLSLINNYNSFNYNKLK
jgi:hypothetical protein